jgi:hypothetical protein
MPALSCATCGVPIPAGSGRGRPRKYCTQCRPRSGSPLRVNATSCARCGVTLTHRAIDRGGNRRKYCPSCRNRHEKVGPRSYHATCKFCATQFQYSVEGNGRRRKFCSKTCRAEHHRAIRHTYPNQVYKRRYYLKHGMQNLKRFQKTCLICDKPFETPNNKTVTCGMVCGGKLTIQRASRNDFVAARVFKDDLERWRQSCHARRARIAGSQRIRSIEIYERDGWLCGICGAPVEAARKAPDPLSPTLDHIVPLSRGGEHSRLNVQCAHLGCNSRKGAREGLKRRTTDTPAPIAGSGS